MTMSGDNTDTKDIGERYESFDAFWPYYLSEHADPTNRRLHQVGTTLALSVAGIALAKRRPWLVPVAFVAGYGPSWVGHFFVEKNRPATFSYPLWSLLADFRMNALMWRGELETEFERLGLSQRTRSDESAA